MKVTLISRKTCVDTLSKEYADTEYQEKLEVNANITILKYVIHTGFMVKAEKGARKRGNVNSGIHRCAIILLMKDNASKIDVVIGISEGLLQKDPTTITNIVKTTSMKTNQTTKETVTHTVISNMNKKETSKMSGGKEGHNNMGKKDTDKMDKLDKIIKL